MKNKGAGFLIFMASLVVGFLLVINVNYEGSSFSSSILSAKEYQAAQNERTSLYKELTLLKESYNQSLRKIESYISSTESTKKVLEDMKAEAEVNNMLLGYSAVNGQGITMIISDGSVDYTLGVDDLYLQALRTVHNYDMMQIINELKLAGAEVISVNNQRILPNSEIYCSWAFISVNGVKLPSPFVVTAIGDMDILENYLTRAESYTKQLINRGINVYIEKTEKVVMPAISKSIEANHIKGLN